MMGSDVFHQMFTSNFSETQTNPPCVQLPGKTIQHMIWMLDYLYPDKVMTLTGKTSQALRSKEKLNMNLH